MCFGICDLGCQVRMCCEVLVRHCVYIFSGPVGKTKGFRSHRSWVQVLALAVFKHIINYTKNLPNFRKFFGLSIQFCSCYRPRKSIESTDSWFECQPKLCDTFYSRNFIKIFSSKYRIQLRPMSILSHTGGADLDHSRLVFFSCKFTYSIR